jgi:hypothetical protein
MIALFWCGALAVTHVAMRRRADDPPMCAAADWDETKTRTWPDAVHSHDTSGALDSVTTGGTFGQVTVDITTWQPFEQVTISFPDGAQFQVRSAWSATLVAMDDVEVVPDDEMLFDRGGGNNEPWWDTMRNMRSVTFEIGCTPTQQIDDDQASYVGSFGVILHTAQTDLDDSVMELGWDEENAENSYEGAGAGGAAAPASEAPTLDLQSIALSCTDPPMASDDELNAERDQCEAHGSYSAQLPVAHGSYSAQLPVAHGSYSAQLPVAHGSYSAQLPEAHGSYSAQLPEAHGSYSAAQLPVAHGSYSAQLPEAHGSYSAQLVNQTSPWRPVAHSPCLCGDRGAQCAHMCAH